MSDRLVIVGASLAGARAAQALRQAGFDGSLMLVGDEAWLPYERPSLSKDGLAGAAEPVWVCPAPLYAEQRIELRLGQRVSAIRGHEGAFGVQLQGGETLAADRVLLATGGRARELPQAQGLQQIYTLRSWDDSLRLRERLRPGLRLLVIGSGFIGAEVAATAAQLGCQVTMLDAAPQLFGAIRSTAVRQRLHDAHRQAGTVLRAGVAIEAMYNDADGSVRVRLAGGEELVADAVVVGIGMQPNAELAAAAGAELAMGGVRVDEVYRSTVPGLYAAGDVAARIGADGQAVRSEHWRSAQEQGAAAAMAMLNQTAPALSLPWAWSDQLGHRLEIAGEPAAGSTLLERSPSEREHLSFHLDGTRLVGITSWNAQRALRPLLKLLHQGWHPRPDQLIDPQWPLAKVETLTPAKESR